MAQTTPSDSSPASKYWASRRPAGRHPQRSPYSGSSASRTKIGTKPSVESLLPKASPNPSPAASKRGQSQPGRDHNRHSKNVASSKKAVPPTSVVL